MAKESKNNIPFASFLLQERRTYYASILSILRGGFERARFSKRRFGIKQVGPILLGRIALLTLGFVLAVSLACSSAEEEPLDLGDVVRSPETAIVVPADGAIVIGTSSALTGPVGPRGTEYRDSVLLAIVQWKTANGPLIAGHEIVVQSEDDGCSAGDIAATAAERLLNRPGLVGVIGPQCSGGATAAIPIYNAGGVVAISGSATQTDLATAQGSDGFFFRTAFRNDMEAFLIGDFLGGLAAEAGGEYRVYFIDDAEPYGLELADLSQELSATAGVTVLRESIPQGVIDFSEAVSRILEAEVDFVGYFGFNPEAGQLLRQLRDAGYAGPYGSVDAAASQGAFVDPLGSVAEGALFAGCQVELPADFSEQFAALHGHGPGGATFAGQYYDATIILLNAINAVAEAQADGSLTIDPRALRDAVRGTFHEDALTGRIAFDQNGDRVPEPGANLLEAVAAGFAADDSDTAEALGFYQCQVQDGVLVNVSGPDAPAIRLP